MAQEQAQQGGGGTNLSEIFMAIFVLLLIVLLLCELPNWIVNICICLNITLGVVLLMISLYVKKTLDWHLSRQLFLLVQCSGLYFQLHQQD